MSPPTTATEGLIPFVVLGETFQTWFKAFGDLANRSHPPLVVLHGGPGFSHDYLFPISDLSISRPVIFYDQIGNGNSRSPLLREKPKEFWTIDLFIDELENLLAHFHIQDNYDLIGHSWGGIMGVELEVRRQPAGLRKLVLSNSLPSMALWNQANAELLAKFPQEVQDGVKNGFADIVKYRAAISEFRAVHGCLVKPRPQEYTRSLDQVFGEDGNPAVAMAMFSGELKEWNIIDRLPDIRVPVLVLNGKADIARDYVVKPFIDKVRNVQWVKFENSSHMPMWEEREKYMEVIEGFLNN